MGRRRFRRVSGLIPRLGASCWHGIRWGIRHPQPLIVLIVFVAGAGWLWKFATHSEAFRITTIQLPPKSTFHLPDSLIGKNLWRVNLEDLAEHLKAQQPFLQRVRVIRRLPNLLQIEVLERTPVAQVKLGQWHPVALDGVILPVASPQPWDHLPILKGIEGPHASLHVGDEPASPRLQEALRLVQVLRRSSALIGHHVTLVDVGDPAHLTLMLDDAIEVRCGSEQELNIHLERLRTVLRRLTNQPLVVRYIDVRFKEPVIGPTTSG